MPSKNAHTSNKSVAVQTEHNSLHLTFDPSKMTKDKHCYECRVRYRDPKPQDLIMYLHAWKYKVSTIKLKFNSISHIYFKIFFFYYDKYHKID